MLKDGFYLYFLDKVKKTADRSVQLSGYSSFKIGGRADYFFEATSISELKSAILTALKFPQSYYVIGGGYNILFDDDGFRGLIIRNKAEGIKLLKNGEVEVLSGTLLNQLTQFLEEKGISGLEFMAGIPGTVGGAIFGNAGAFSQSIGDCLDRAFFIDRHGKDIRVRKDFFEFSYRQSSLKKKHRILTKAVFKLQKGDKSKIREITERDLKMREKKHTSKNIPCAGSYFKNPVLPDGKREAVGPLLEAVGARDLRIGDAAVFSGHANFIINKGNASAKDVLSLAQELKKRVREKFGIELEEEVIFIPATSSIP